MSKDTFPPPGEKLEKGKIKASLPDMKGIHSLFINADDGRME